MELVLAPTITDLEPVPQLPGQLLDGIVEALVHRPGSCSQSLMVLALVEEIHDVAVWLLDDPGSAELASLGRVLAEARAHHNRMNGPQPTTGSTEPAATSSASGSFGTAVTSDPVAAPATGPAAAKSA